MGNLFCQFPTLDDPVGGGERIRLRHMTDIHAMYREAEELKDNQQYDEAIAKLSELLAADADHVLSHLALAVLYGRVDDHEKAIEHGRRACEIEPQDAFGFTALSVTYQRAWQGTQKQEYIHMAEEAMARAHALQ